MVRIGLTLFCLMISFLASAQKIEYDTTFSSNGQKYRVQQIQLEKYMSLLRISKGPTAILADTLAYFPYLQVVDFNQDGLVDIRITYMGNVDSQSLYLFDNSRRNFHRV